jgi:hypothetical protein
MTFRRRRLAIMRGRLYSSPEAARMASEDARCGLPSAREPNDGHTSGQRRLEALTRVLGAALGADWYLQEPKLETPIHQTHHEYERARVRTHRTKERLAQAMSERERFRFSPEVALHGHRRQMGATAYWACTTLLVVVEAFLNYGALLILGDTALRMVGAIGLAGALFLLAHGIGEAVKGRQTEDPHTAPTLMVVFMVGAAAGLMYALARLRATALAVAVASAVAEAGSASSGSTAGPVGAFHLPSVPVGLYVLLMLGGFVAAVECSRRHGHHLAHEEDRLERTSEHRERDVDRALDGEVQAASARDAAMVQWAGGFATHQERAEELAASGAADQALYRQRLRLLVGKEVDLSAVPDEPQAVAASWTRSPAPAERIGEQRFPRIEALWPGGFAYPGSTNGNGRAEIDSDPKGARRGLRLNDHDPTDPSGGDAA